MGIFFTLVIFIIAGWFAATVGFAVDVYAGYALVGGLAMIGIGWLRSL